MTAREQLIRELEHIPDALIEELLDFLLFIKLRRKPQLDYTGATSFRQGWRDVIEGNTIPVAQLWEGIGD